MKRLAIFLILFFINISPLYASPEDDVNYIVDQTVTRTLFEGSLQALRPVLISAIKNDLNSKGIEISDASSFLDIFVDEFIDEFTDIMKQETVGIYRELFSDSELADLAAFYKTETGQKLILQTPLLMQAGAKSGEVAGMKAGRNAKERVAQRLESEGIMIEKNKSLTKKIIDALR